MAEHEDRVIVAALNERAERGVPRGAEAVVAAAWAETGAGPVALAPGDGSRRRRTRQVWFAAAAALLIVTVVVAKVGLDQDRVTVGPGDGGAPSSAPARRVASVVVPGTRFNPNSRTLWTGSEVIVVGGFMRGPVPGYREIGESPALDLLSGQLRLIPAPPALLNDWQMSAVWTGHEVLLVAYGHAAGSLDSRPLGFAYDTDRGWHPTAAPPPLYGMVWAGDRVLGWTGWEMYSYDPGADTWTKLAAFPGRELDRLGPAVWTGSELVFLGHTTVVFRDGPTPELMSVAPPPFEAEYAAWTGSSIVTYRNDVEGGSVGVAFFDPDLNRWTEGRRAPQARLANFNEATWVAGKLVLPETPQWEPGPANPDESYIPRKVTPSLGLTYDPSTDTWATMPSLPLALHTSPAGDQLVVWSNETVEPGPTTLAASIWTPPGDRPVM